MKKSDLLDTYLNNHTTAASSLLEDLERETHLKVLQPIMLSGFYQGRLLSMISKLIQPTSILELGTFTGYSTLCMAEGLAADGKIHTIDINEELVDLQRRYFNKSPWGKQIIQYTGDAVEIIPTLNMRFDLIFIDADKPNYPIYFELIIDKLMSGGLIVSDNVLWHGKVLSPDEHKDEATQALIEYNNILCKDHRLESIVLPVRDGLTLSRKK